MVRNEYETDPRKTPEWREAEKWYNQLHTHSTFSIMGGVLISGSAAEELNQATEEILQVCPMYFPAWFHRGEFMLRIGRTSEGEEFIEKAFDYVVKIVEDEEEFRQILSQRMGNLEKLLRYDLAARYTEKATRIFPDTPAFYDDLAFYILQLPDRNHTEALKFEEEALEIEPDNDFFINNLGWIYLMMGNYELAEENFRKALEFNLDNPGACENLETAEYMHEQNLSYFDYLLRPADMAQLQALLEYGDFQEVAALCKLYNTDRLEGFKIHHLQKGSLPPHEILNTLQPLKFFINMMEKMVDAADDGFFLLENIDMFNEKSRSLFYRFILGVDHIYEELVNDISRSLAVFYEFLRDINRVTSSQYDRFISRTQPLITGFSRKIEDYNRLRHDVTLEEADREEKIERLFS